MDRRHPPTLYYLSPLFLATFSRQVKGSWITNSVSNSLRLHRFLTFSFSFSTFFFFIFFSFRQRQQKEKHTTFNTHPGHPKPFQKVESAGKMVFTPRLPPPPPNDSAKHSACNVKINFGPEKSSIKSSWNKRTTRSETLTTFGRTQISHITFTVLSFSLSLFLVQVQNAQNKKKFEREFWRVSLTSNSNFGNDWPNQKSNILDECGVDFDIGQSKNHFEKNWSAGETSIEKSLTKLRRLVLELEKRSTKRRWSYSWFFLFLNTHDDSI